MSVNKYIARASLGLLFISATAAQALAQQAPAFQMPSAGVEGLPTPMGGAAKAQPAASSMATKLPVNTNLLSTVMSEQEEMLLLDLQIKKATMEQQLKEIQGQSSASTSAASMKEVDKLLQSSLPAAPTLDVSDMGRSTQSDAPTLVRISKQNDELVALVELPDGGRIMATSGTVLPGDWKIVSITPTAATASYKDKKPVSLKYASTTTGTGSTRSIGSSSSVIRPSGLR